MQSMTTCYDNITRWTNLDNYSIPIQKKIFRFDFPKQMDFFDSIQHITGV